MQSRHVRRRWVVVAVLACLLCGATTAQAQASGSGDRWWGTDKALHFSFSAAISVGSYALAIPIWDEPLPRAVFAASLGLGAGVAKEVYDLAGYGDPSYRDLAWDVIGVAFGTALALLIDLWLRDDASIAPKARPKCLAFLADGRRDAAHDRVDASARSVVDRTSPRWYVPPPRALLSGGPGRPRLPAKKPGG